MADQKDSLETILKITGGDLYQRTMQGAASATRLLEQAQDAQEKSTRRLEATNARMLNRFAGRSLGAVGIEAPGATRIGVGPAVALGAITTASAAIKAAVSEAMDYERESIRLQGALKSMGDAAPVSQFQDLARAQSLATGASQDQLLVFARQLTMQRASAATTENLMRIAAQMSQATGKSVEEAAAALEAAHRGDTNALLNDFGIRILAAKGYLLDYAQIAERVGPKVADSARLMANSSAGAADRMKASWRDAGLALGQAATPSAGVFNFLNSLGRGIAAQLRSPAPFTPLGSLFFLNAFHDAPGQAAGGAAGRAVAGGTRSEELLRRIEENTGPMGPLGRTLRGGGSYEEVGGPLRIRDLNAMFKRTGGG